MQTRTPFILTLTIIITLAAGSAFGNVYSGGNGTAVNPYQIAIKADLLALRANTGDYGKCFILTADIDMQGQVFTTAIIAPDTVAGNWRFDGTAFTGTFDGNGHKITGFTINGGSNSYIGLFGVIDSGGSVKNLGLENFAVSSSRYYIGGLVGGNYGGNISNCYSMGSVSAFSDPWASWYVGGLVGVSNGNISNCHSTGIISGDGSWSVGGLVGGTFDTDSMSNCYSTGTVSGFLHVGGLVGSSRFGCSISNCYSMGSVSGADPSGSWGIGGLVGVNGGSVSNCYSTGTVSGSSGSGGIGGLVGDGDIDSSVSGSFWDIQTSGQTTSDGGTGKTTAEMKTLSTFTSAGWDFVEAWGIGNGQTYPYLKTFNGINLADFDYDGKVDFADFAIFAENWLSGE
jgi:hypothetical protein